MVLDSSDRQPVHVVYGGAQLFKAETPARLGALALELIRTYTPDASSFAECLGLPPGELATFRLRTHRRQAGTRASGRFSHRFRRRLRVSVRCRGRRPRRFNRAVVGARSREARVPAVYRNSHQAVHRCPSRAFSPHPGSFPERAFSDSSASLPNNFVVTLPKITAPGQVAELVELLDKAEARHGLKPGALKIELMIETPQNIIDSTGSCGIPKLLEAAQGPLPGPAFRPL